MASTSPWYSKAFTSFHRYSLLAVKKWKRLTTFGKLFILFLVLFYSSLLALVIVLTPKRIAQYLYDKSHVLAQQPFGWLVLAAVLVLVSFPPATGHNTVITLCGFAYGMKGFFIAAPASLVGACLSFVVLRALFRERLHSWSSSNSKWQALESVVEAKGLPLIILIRVSPFPPWVYSNALFASIETTPLWKFAVATCFTFPVILVKVFIGSRVAAISDGDQRDKMDTQTKVINGVLILGGVLLTVATSALVYHFVKQEVREMKDDPSETDTRAARAIENAEEGAPLLRGYSDD